MKKKIGKVWIGFLNVSNKHKLATISIAVIACLLIVVSIALCSLKDKNDILRQKELKVSLSDSECHMINKWSLKKAAKKIDLNYEVIDVKVGYDDRAGQDVMGKIFKITLDDVNSDFYIKISNNYTKEEVDVEVKGNKAVYETRYTNDPITYKVDIYVKNGDCKNEKYRSFEFTTPVINNLYDLKECQGNKFKYCAKYLYESQIGYDEFKIELEKYKAGA